MTKKLVISFRMCRDKIGWLYEYNNKKMVEHMVTWKGFWLYPFNQLLWVGYIYTTNTYSSSVLVIYKWLCIYDKPSFYNQMFDHLMVIELVI